MASKYSASGATPVVREAAMVVMLPAVCGGVGDGVAVGDGVGVAVGVGVGVAVELGVGVEDGVGSTGTGETVGDGVITGVLLGKASDDSVVVSEFPLSDKSCEVVDRLLSKSPEQAKNVTATNALM